MHSLMSQNQLAGWNSHTDVPLEEKARKKAAAEFELVDLEGGSWTIQVPRRINKKKGDS